MRLGLEATRDALLVIVTNGIAAAVPGFEAHAETLRRRALAAGIAARLIAKTLRVESGHDFLVGLLHDVGELVLLQRAAEEGILPPGVLDDPTDGPVILEAIEEDHTRVGAALCRAWGLPPAVAEAAEFHHDRRAGRRGRLPVSARGRHRRHRAARHGRALAGRGPSADLRRGGPVARRGGRRDRRGRGHAARPRVRGRRSRGAENR